MIETTLFEQINDYANRANPFPLYAKLRQTPVARDGEGRYLVSSYRLISELLHDPRLSSDIRKNKTEDAQKVVASHDPNMPVAFLRLDPPEHDRLRRMVTRQFGPPHSPDLIDSMKGELTETVNGLLDKLQGRTRFDIVDDFAYPFPVTVICKLLGVPHEDEPRFHVWAEALVDSLEPLPKTADTKPETMNPQQAMREIGQYMAGLINKHRANPGNDMLSRLVTDQGPDGQLDLLNLVSTSILLLIAGHETTVNLITNSMLTLLRHPQILDRLRKEPELVIPLVEEVLRFEPPVQFNVQRSALSDIAVDGVTIPEGSRVFLMLAAANRDPARFESPESFIPDREDNQHFGFGSGIHYCFGAPLARLEVQTALTALAQRLVNPRLVTDPPPYRQSPVLRGPRHLLIDVDAVLPRQ